MAGARENRFSSKMCASDREGETNTNDVVLCGATPFIGERARASVQGEREETRAVQITSRTFLGTKKNVLPVLPIKYRSREETNVVSHLLLFHLRDKTRLTKASEELSASVR